MKVTNISSDKIYLADLRLVPEGQTVGRRGEDRYLAAGASVYLCDTSEVLRSAHYGTIKGWVDAGVVTVNDTLALASLASSVMTHDLGYLPSVEVFKQVGSTWVEATGAYDLVHNATFTTTTITNTTGGALTFLVRLG